MKHLSVDIETYSDVDIKKAGLYKYVQSHVFEVILFAYSEDFGPVQVVDVLCGERIPEYIIRALFDANVIKHAYNAAFEWYCLSKYFQVPNIFGWLPEWQCTMVHGLYCGYTAGLAATGEALGLPQDKKKMHQGTALIKVFCTPKKPARANGYRTRTLPAHEPEKWRLFKEYNRQDVVTEMEIYKRLSHFPVPESEQRLWQLDMKINACGVAIDRDLVEGALVCSETIATELMTEARELSKLDNPKSVAQLKKWLEEETEEEISDLQKETVKTLISTTDNERVRRMLEIRQELSKTSVRKYQAMSICCCDDGRARGLLQFYGANRTGRWSGRLIQVQNLPRNYISTLDIARKITSKRDFVSLKMMFGSVPDTLSQLVRTAFIPTQGNIFVVADFSAIEARVLSWLAGETWRQEVFATHGKIYEASASQMFGVPIEKIKKGNPEYALRQKGKVAELALGYQGASGALAKMGALKMGLSNDELPEIVQRWRNTNKRIVDFWYALEAAAIHTISTGQPTGTRGILFAMEGDCETCQYFMTITLPSKRKLYYAYPSLTKNQWGRDSILYYGMDQKTRKWIQLDAYGGKLTENIVQAIARDCLAVAIERLMQAGYMPVMHIHDEVVLDVPLKTDEAHQLSPEEHLEKACSIMGCPIDWAPGLLLRADGFTTEFYKKD